jgi:hypothetical protein
MKRPGISSPAMFNKWPSFFRWTKPFCLGVPVFFIVLASSFAQGPTWEANLTTAKQAFVEHRYGEAERAYLAALAQAENFGPKDPRLATTVFGLGVLYYVQSRYEEAEPLLQRTVELREAEPAPDPSGIAKAILQLAELYRATQHFDKARPLYQRALALSLDLPNPNPVTIATVHLDLGLLCSSQNRLRDAESEYLLAVCGFQSSTGTDRKGLGFSLLNLAKTYEAENKFSDAESRYKQAINVFEEASGPNGADRVTAVENYARLLRKLNRKSEASEDKQRLDNSLEATMKFIQDKLNSIGPVKYVTHAHDARNGGDWTNKFEDEVSGLVANPSVCRIYYHWFSGVEGTVTMDKEVGFALYDVQRIRVLTREELFNSDNAATGRASWTAKVEPSVYVLLVQRPAPRENQFVFFDEGLANQVAKALEHAVELCGGKLNQ